MFCKSTYIRKKQYLLLGEHLTFHEATLSTFTKTVEF